MDSRFSPAMQIYADTETIPTQRADILAELTEANHAERDAELAKLAPPKNIKKAETIDAWMVNELPAKQDEIRDKFDAALQETIHKTCLDGAFGHLAVISLALGDEAPLTLWDSNWDAAGYEAWLLNELERATKDRCRHHRGQTLIGHNIAFDRNMIRQRGIVLGVPVHPLWTKPVKPWENDLVCDTMIEWTGDPRNRISLDKLCKALGVDGKGTDLADGEYIDGSQVWDFIQRGEIAKVATYCGRDVERARNVYKLMRGATPRMPQPTFAPGLPRGAALIGVDMGAGDQSVTALINGEHVEFPEPSDGAEPAALGYEAGRFPDDALAGEAL